jgi:hypothetical protein
MRPRWIINRAEKVIQGLQAGLPQVEKARRPARSQHSARLTQGLQRVAHEHVAEPAEDAVDARVVEVDVLGIQDAELGARDPELLCHALGSVDHLRREVARDGPALFPEAGGGEEAGLTRAGSEFQDRLLGLRIDPVHEPFADFVGRSPGQLPAPLPWA